LKIRPALIAAAVPAFLVLSGLCVPAFYAGRENYRNLLLVSPLGLSSPRIDVSKIEQFCEDQFLAGYEISRGTKASQVRAGSPVEIPDIQSGTNSAWPRVTLFPFIDGSFFSKQAWEGKLRQAVLNKEAARRIFGGVKAAGNRLRMDGETWIVTGVVNDGDKDNCRVYVPSSVRGGTADSLMVLLDPAGRVSEGYAKNSLKTLGVQDKDFSFYNLETQARLPWERVRAALEILAIILIAGALPPGWKKTAAGCRELRGELKSRYPRELFALRRKELLRLAALILVLAAAVTAALILALNLAALCLPWQDLPALADLGPDYFPPKLAILRSVDLPSRILFRGALGLMGFFVLMIFFPRGRGKLPGPAPQD
jgi:hypothetical protein